MASNKQILDQFNKEYRFIYDTEMNGASVAGASDAMRYFDDSMKNNPKFHDKIISLAEDRQDMFTSDRECAAIVFALEVLGVLDEIER